MSNKIDQHALVSLLKDMAIELGRTPTMREFCGKYGHQRAVENCGGFIILCQAAGLENNGRPRKITNQVFEVPIESHLSKYEPRSNPIPNNIDEKHKRCLFIPDFHAPWGDLKVIEAAAKFAKENGVEVIVQLGDLYDFISHSRFPTSKNIYTPRDEQSAARKQAEEMWAILSAAAPHTKKYQAWGNHDQRPLKRILETYPEASDWIEKMINSLMSFEGVETLSDQRQELILPGNVMCIHGYLSRPGSHRDYNLGFNVVHGHLHTAHVMYKQIQGKILWEMNCGIAADIYSKAFSYTPQKSLNWSKGFGWLDENGPRFVHV